MDNHLLNNTKMKTMKNNDNNQQLDSSNFTSIPNSNLDSKVEEGEPDEQDENSECRPICSPSHVKKPKISISGSSNGNVVGGSSTPCLISPSPDHFQQQTSNFPGFFPPGYPIQVPNQMGSLDNSCQVPSSNEQVTASTNPSQIPGAFHQFGNAHPHQPYSARPWDPSSGWAQMQQFPPFCPFPFPPIAPQPTANRSSTSGMSSQKGVPPANIYQNLPPPQDFQSAVNAQLWAAISGLHASLADIRNHLIKLEPEGKILKPEGEQLAAHNTGNISTSQGAKRARSTNLVPSDEPRPTPPQSRTPAFNKPPPMIKEINFQKDHENKAEFMEAMSPRIPTHHANSEKFRRVVTSSSNPIEVSSTCPPHRISNPPNIPQSQGHMKVPSSFEANDAIAKLEGQVKIPKREPLSDCEGGMISADSHGNYYQPNVSSIQGNGGTVNGSNNDLNGAMKETDKEEAGQA